MFFLLGLCTYQTVSSKNDNLCLIIVEKPTVPPITSVGSPMQPQALSVADILCLPEVISAMVDVFALQRCSARLAAIRVISMLVDIPSSLEALCAAEVADVLVRM